MNGDVTLNGIRYTSFITFHDNGQVESRFLSGAQTIQGRHYHHFYQIRFDEDGTATN